MDTNSTHSLWVEKYRPQKLEDFIGNEKVIEKIKSFIDKGEIPQLLFYADPGSGKTTLGKIITNIIPCDCLYINASDENNVDTIRTKVRNFATTAGFNNIKIVFLDEADYLTSSAQSILRNLMETYSKHTRFILTCNYVDKIMPALQSRFQTFKITPPDKKEVFKRLAYILKNEGVDFDTKNKNQLSILKVIVDKNFPDVRKCINILQQNVIGNELVLDETTLLENDYTKKIIEILSKKPTSIEDYFIDCKQILVDSQVKTFEPLFRDLYKEIDGISFGKQPQILQIIAEYQYQSNFVIDKEISAMAMLMRIVQMINSK